MKTTKTLIRLSVAAAFLFSFASCIKEASQPVEPTPYRPVSSDTIRSGELWGLHIGTEASEIYPVLQQIRIERQVGYLGIVGNVFNNLNAIEGKIELYNSLFMDETAGTSTGVQLSFEAEKVKAIYTNNGAPLSKWPGINDYSDGIGLGDSISSIFGKLVAIKNLPVYGTKLQRLSLFDKNLLTDYDPGMAASSQWQVVTAAVEKRWTLLELNLSGGILQSINRTIYENY